MRLLDLDDDPVPGGAVPDVSIVTSGHDVADARLHREAAALVRAGLTVEVLGLGRPQDGPPGATVRAVPRRGSIGRAALAGQLARRARGRALITLDPDSALAAAAMCRLTGQRLVVDVHEDYAALLRDRPWANRWKGMPGRAARAVVAGFQMVARHADLTVVADEHVPPSSARRRIVLRNLPDLALLPAPAAPEARPRALYIGDVRATRGLYAMLEAMRRVPDWSLDIVGPVAPADSARLDQELAMPDLAGRVRMHGRLPPAQAWSLAPGAWGGLLLLSDTPAFTDALPSKLWEYFACGLPVVASDLPRQGAAVRSSGAGTLVTATDEAGMGAATASALRTWQADPQAFDVARERAAATGREKAAEAGYEQFAEAVRDLACAARRAGEERAS